MAMSIKTILALALAFVVIQAVPASAGPRTCGFSTFQYDSSGATVGPYCH
jgi:hypothetical protein